jgi:uncharacterized RDD family membrane protein YckC
VSGPAPPLHETTAGEPRQVVRSPDQVALELPLAGPTSRLLAYAVDSLLLWTTVFGAALACFAAIPAAARALARLAERLGQLVTRDVEAFVTEPVVVLVFAGLIVAAAAAEIGWFVAWELATGGRSPGKALLGLRAMRDGGQPIDASASLLRNLLRVVDVLPMNYLVGFVAMLASPEGKRLGDLVAGTVVVRLDRPGRAAPLELPAEADEAGFRFAREQLARLGASERALARQTLRRVDELPPERAEEALARAVGALCQRLGYAEEVPVGERAAFLRALLRAARRS